MAVANGEVDTVDQSQDRQITGTLVFDTEVDDSMIQTIVSNILIHFRTMCNLHLLCRSKGL